MKKDNKIDIGIIFIILGILLLPFVWFTPVKEMFQFYRGVVQTEGVVATTRVLEPEESPDGRRTAVVKYNFNVDARDFSNISYKTLKPNQENPYRPEIPVVVQYKENNPEISRLKDLRTTHRTSDSNFLGLSVFIIVLGMLLWSRQIFKSVKNANPS
ncbi:MAG: DUF3592 domain-containing protein [Vulcanimicrobiota bacterium]